MIFKEIESYINKSFFGCKTLKLGSLITHIKRSKSIPAGTLVIMASGDAQLRLKILEKDTPHKGFSEPLLLNDVAVKSGITTNYLHWYLTNETVSKSLMGHATGSVFLRIPLSTIKDIPIPIPKTVFKTIPIEETVLKKDDEFRELLNSFYQDYLLNVKNKRYRTSLILAGAMTEAIIYQLLLEHGVDKKILDNDRGLGMGKLITYLKLLKLDKSLSLPMTDFSEIQRKRNKAVHVGSQRNKPHLFCKEDIVCFNHVIKHFGI